MNNGESKMKILNIHAGINDKEIVDLYEKTTIELLKNSEKIKISSKKIYKFLKMFI